MIQPRGGRSGEEVQDSPTFDVARAFEDARRLAFPRRVGTPGERRAARLIERSFEASGLVSRRECFPVPFLARGAWVRAVLALAGLLAIVGLWLGPDLPWASAGCWLLVMATSPLPWRLSGWMAKGWPARLSSCNVLAALRFSGEPEPPARVVFLAHHDSKSQPLPTGVRVGLVIAVITASGILALGNLVAALGGAGPVIEALRTTLGWVATSAIAALALNFTGNRGPGALDNASGVATLLELARTWRPRPEAPVEPLWVATGAEEIGLDGARDFVRRHEAWCRAHPTLIVNLDSVGAGDRVYLAGDPSALALARESAERLRQRWARLRWIGAGMDHQPLTDRGLMAVSLLGDVVGRSLTMHSPRDTVDRIEPEALQRAGELAAEIAWTWAERQRTRSDATVQRSIPDRTDDEAPKIASLA